MKSPNKLTTVSPYLSFQAIRHISYVVIALCCFSACEKTIKLDLEQGEEMVIIEGLVTDEETRHYVKVTKSVPFDRTGVTPRVTGAQVTVRDDEGQEWVYVETDPGYYEAPAPFAGAVGRTYHLQVDMEGTSYTASEELLPNGTIDSLGFRIDEEEREETNGQGLFHEVLLYLTEPPATQDYYLFKMYRDGEILTDDGETVFYTDDIAVRENVEGFPIPFFFTVDQTARIELYSTTRRAYLYFRDLQENVDNDGGMFSGQPANVSTNIEGGAMGYFQVSSKREKEILITE